MKIDVYNPDNYLNGIPHEQFQWLRDNAPVYWHEHPAGGGYWVLSKHADVMAVSRDFQTFSAEQGFVLVDDLPESTLEMARNQLLGMDPPRHAKPRRAVITRFTSSRLKALEPQIRTIAQEIMQAAQGKDTLDFVDDLAGDLPTAVICQLMDIPRDKWKQIRTWSDMQTSSSDPDLGGSEEEVLQASIEMGTYGFELACERKDKGGDDLISLLINQQVDGELISEAEFASLFVQIAVAGNETTRGLISSACTNYCNAPSFTASWKRHRKNSPWLLKKCCAGPVHYTTSAAPQPATPRLPVRPLRPATKWSCCTAQPTSMNGFRAFDGIRHPASEQPAHGLRPRHSPVFGCQSGTYGSTDFLRGILQALWWRRAAGRAELHSLELHPRL